MILNERNPGSNAPWWLVKPKSPKPEPEVKIIVIEVEKEKV
jgi:hypothetical protein